MTTENNQILERLLKAVEERAGIVPVSPAGFSSLASAISESSAGLETVSVSTLKRLWGYVGSTHHPSETVLSILARFCGYRNWSHFISSPVNDSGFLVVSPILANQLATDALIELWWAPDRYALLRHIGDDEFIVEASRNAKIIAGDSLRASLFCQGYPLYATDIRRGTTVIPAYVAARKGGMLKVSRISCG